MSCLLDLSSYGLRIVYAQSNIVCASIKGDKSHFTILFKILLSLDRFLGAGLWGAK